MHLIAKIGHSTYAFENWRQLSNAYRDTIDALGVGASRTPACIVFDQGGHVVAHVSYNGKVWPGAKWHEGVAPIYVPE